MEFSAGVFEVLASEDHEAQQALSKAAAVATKRVTEQFGQFLAASTSLEQYLHRYDFVFDDLKNTVTATAEEYGANPEHVLAGVEARFKRQPEPVDKTASTHESRRPKLCPYHSEVTDISLAQGEPRAGFDAMAQHAWGPQHCQGGEYEGGRCNFKREMTTQAFWDAKAEQAEQRRQEREQLRQEQEDATELPEFGPDNDTPADFEENTEEPFEAGDPTDLDATVIDAPTEEPQAEVPMAMAASSDLDAPLARSADLVKEAPGGQHSEAWGESGSKRNRQYEHIKEQCLADGGSEEHCKEMAARTVNKTRSEHGETKSHTVEAEALETVKVDKDSEGPVPKMDKGKWTPETGNEIDTEGEGSPHPTRRKDVTEVIEETNASDRFEETDAVLEKQDVEKSEGPQKGKGGTFPKGNGADPVTSAVDPSTNPLREILLEQDDGFPEETQILSAIRQAR